jgi:hypothetical protein
LSATPEPDDAPFPLGSVQAVASRAGELGLREDPVGLLIIPFIITFPVFVFLTILGELYRHPDALPQEASLLTAVFGVLPLVAFAFVFGEAWILWRADAEAHGRRVGFGETVKHAFSRTWYLVVVVLARYALFQIGLFFFVLPGLLVAIGASFATQAAVLGPGRLIASLKQSWDLVEHNVGQWFGMLAYWLVIFVGLGILISIMRVSLENLTRGPLSFVLDLLLWLPLQVSLLVCTTCWTLFYRELEARRHSQLRFAHSAHPDIPARAS